MDPRSAAGLTTIQYVVGSAVSLLLFVMLANAVVDLYTRGVARAAVDEAARAGAALDASTTDCERRAADLLVGVVPTEAIHVTCREEGGAMHARARVELAGWLPGVPTWRFTLDGQVLKEEFP